MMSYHTEVGEFEPQIVGFFCNWCCYTGDNISDASQTEFPPNVRVIRVMCSGRIDGRFILEAFIAGADGILICGCQPGDCHFQKGNLSAWKRVAGLSPLLDILGIGKDRLRLEWVPVASAPKVAEAVESFTQTIKQLGPSPLKRQRGQHCLSTK